MCEYVYKRKDVYKRIKEYVPAFIKGHGIALGDSAVDTFYARLAQYKIWDGFDEESAYTNKTWFRFVEDWLNRTQARDETKNLLINKLVKATPIIKAMLVKNNKTEAYMLTGKELLLYMKGLGVHQFSYIVELYMKHIAVDNTIENKKLKYEDIPITDFIYAKKKDEKSNSPIYTFEEYQLVFNYCLDIKSHVERGIQHLAITNKRQYFSMWLYVIIHLNDSWRHGDVVEFPVLELEDLIVEYKIDTVEWFLNNEVTLEMARRVFFRVHQWELIMHKTNVEGMFWCSDLVLPAFATVVFILYLLRKNEEIPSEHLIEFHTKYNRVNTGIIKNFFCTKEFEEFSFTSLKFNKTVMTFIYYIANLSGDPKSLVYAAKMRAHTNEMTTLAHYVKINKNAIEELSLQLLKRGEFGYVTAMLLKKLNGEHLEFEDLTTQIEALNNNFGDVLKVNSTIGFMNTLRNERKELLSQINSMTFEEIQELMTDIYLRKVPSKDSKEILCAYGRKGCVDCNQSCFDCMYHIPTIYSLTSLYRTLCQDIEDITNCKVPAKKVAILFRIERKKQTIREAIAKFGKDTVYECFECTRDEFMNMLLKVPSTSEIRVLIERS